MGGVLQISSVPRVTWLPQGWLFDAAVRSLAACVRGHPDLVARLTASQVESGGGYLDVSGLPAEMMNALVDAAGAAVDQSLASGPALGAERSAYLRLVYGLSLLKALLEDDPRAAERVPDGTGRMLITQSTEWTAPAPVFDLALEHLAAPLRLVAVEDAQRLIAGRHSAGRQLVDVRDLPADVFSRLLSATAWMSERYVPGSVLEANAEEFFTAAYPSLEELRASIEADARVIGST